jgi:hypothetical protein
MRYWETALCDTTGIVIGRGLLLGLRVGICADKSLGSFWVECDVTCYGHRVSSEYLRG